MSKFLSILLVMLVAGLIFLWAKHRADVNGELEQPVALSNNINVDEWLEYTSPQQSFKVFFPGMPHHAKTNITDPKKQEKREYQVFITTKNDETLYSITEVTFPEKSSATIDEGFLETFIKDELATKPENVIKDIKTTTWKNNKAVDFVVENGGALVNGKVFNKGNTVYILTVTSKPELANEKDFNFFVNSFQLMPH